MNPSIALHDTDTNETIVREMTDEELAVFVAAGWSPDGEIWISDTETETAGDE